MRLTLNFARPPCASSRCEAKALLSRSNENPDRAKDSNGEPNKGVDSDTEYADFVFVPTDACPSKLSPPPRAFRNLAVMFCRQLSPSHRKITAHSSTFASADFRPGLQEQPSPLFQTENKLHLVRVSAALVFKPNGALVQVEDAELVQVRNESPR